MVEVVGLLCALVFLLYTVSYVYFSKHQQSSTDSYRVQKTGDDAILKKLEGIDQRVKKIGECVQEP